MDAVVGEFGVDVVGDDDEVVLLGEVGDAEEIFAGESGAGGVVGEVEEEGAGAGGDALGHHGGGEAEAVLGAGFYAHGDAVSEGDDGAVGDVAGFVVEDFVAGFDDGAEGEVEGFADPDGDEDFVFGFVADVEDAVDVGGEGLAEFEESEVGGVAGDAPLEGVDGGFADVPGGDEVGFADAEADDILHGADDFEEIADAGGGHVPHVAGDGITG